MKDERVKEKNRCILYLVFLRKRREELFIGGSIKYVGVFDGTGVKYCTILQIYIHFYLHVCMYM